MLLAVRVHEAKRDPRPVAAKGDARLAIERIPDGRAASVEVVDRQAVHIVRRGAVRLAHVVPGRHAARVVRDDLRLVRARRKP